MLLLCCSFLIQEEILSFYFLSGIMMKAAKNRRNVKMRAVIYEGNGRIRLGERPVPVIQDERDAIIQVTLTTNMFQ